MVWQNLTVRLCVFKAFNNSSRDIRLKQHVEDRMHDATRLSSILSPMWVSGSMAKKEVRVKVQTSYLHNSSIRSWVHEMAYKVLFTRS